MFNFNGYLHFTNYNCMDDISKYGLVPQVGFRSRAIGDNRNAVFFSKGIINAITMYAAMLHFYKNKPSVCKEEINEYEKYINDLERRYRTMPSQVISDAINELELNMQNRQKLLSCNNLIEFLGGNGCFLSINELDGMVTDNPENCYYEGTIPPSNINIVTLINKSTGEYICSREAVLLYFMCMVPKESVIESVPDDYKNYIIDLYDYYFNLYNPRIRDDIKYNCIIDTIPLNTYNYADPIVKALMFR